MCAGALTADIAEKAVEDGDIQFAMVGRALIVDPQFINKIRDGKQENIRPCLRCNNYCICHFFQLLPLSCAVNPQAAAENMLSIPFTGKPQRVVVIGGGANGIGIGLAKELCNRGAPYAPLKSACLTFVEQFAVMMRDRKTNVTCSAIMPSIVNTEISDRMANPLARPAEFRDNPNIDNTPAPVKAPTAALVKRLADPQTDEDKALSFAMGVVSVNQAVATIMEGLEKGFLYIYTHPGRTAAIIRQEMDLRLAGCKQPLAQSNAAMEYTKLSKSPI